MSGVIIRGYFTVAGFCVEAHAAAIIAAMLT
jgi:hypothetical protein